MAGRKPIHEVRLNGVRAAVWGNTSKEGQVWFNVSVTRNYRDGEQWKESSNFGRDDLPALAKVADLALAWIVAEQARFGHPAEPEESTSKE